MGSMGLPFPVFRSDMFDFSGRPERRMETLLPRHHNRPPRQRDDGNWAVEGILSPSLPEVILLAANITDLRSGDKIIAKAEEIAGLLKLARLDHLGADYPRFSDEYGSAVRILEPLAA